MKITKMEEVQICDEGNIISVIRKTKMVENHTMTHGANSYGQLGHGHKEDVLTPTAVCLDGLDPSTIRTVTGGGGHSLYITDNGSCYSCGWNHKGQLGLGSTTSDKEVTTPRLIPGLSVSRAAGGWDFTMFIATDGELYGCGSNHLGQLGCGLTPVISSPEVISLNERKVTDVACGMRHAVVLCEDGSILTSGVGKKGQLGFLSPEGGAVNKTDHFQKIQLPADCGRPVRVIAGAYHSGAITDAGRVWLWGDNKHGQLAADPSSTPTQPVPRLVSHELLGGETIVSVHSGWTHIVAVTAAGSVYAWGRCDYGQTGTPSATNTNRQWTPSRLSLRHPQQISCGSEHNLLLNKAGQLYSWGWNEHGICGTGNEVNVLEPNLVRAFNDNVKLLGCGNGHSFALIDSIT